MNISICPTCGSRRIKKTRGFLNVHVKGKTVRIPDIESHQCEKCGETLTDIENERRIDAFFSRRARKRAA